MKTTKQILGVLLVLLLLVCPALAEVKLTSEVVSSEMLRLNIQHAEVGEQGDVSLLYYNSLGDANKEAITLRVAGQNVPLSNIERYNGGTAWVLMVDTATVGTDLNDEPVQDTLRYLIENMGPSDEVAIIKTGDTGGNFDLEMRDYYLDPKRLKEAFGKLNINENVTNMYQTMGVALDFLAAQNSSYRRTVLVVVSSGSTENPINMTYDKLKAKIGSSKTTVYTVAYKKDDDNTNRLERFSSLAQASCGGFGVRERYNEDADAVTRDINENEKRFFTATANPSEDITKALEGMEGEALESAVKALEGVKELTLCSANGVESSWPIDEEQWNRIRSKINIEQTPTSVSPTQPPTFWEKTMSFLKDNLTVVIVCIAAVILLVIVLVVFSRHGKKHEDMPSTPGIEDNGPPDAPGEWSNKDRNDSGDVTDIVTEKMSVVITQVGDSSDSWAYEMKNDTMTVGRKSDDAKDKPDLAIRTTDKKMSRIHIQLQYKEGMMIVRDLSSNGTKVNKKTIMRPTVLHQQDILTMGENDYRIVWWRK